MRNFFKQIRCKHDYEKLVDRKWVVDSELIEKCLIYCPKCKKKKIVSEYKYKAIIAQKKIDEEYKKRLKEEGFEDEIEERRGL
ncbi:hypothetical protein IEN91_05485 [Bacillus velezensis]|uniref:hypothetical protein n=1 Tax=Bacillus velezensis TaxID=492670 RepID=UPI0018C45548|nr:hypothetical protein [Bacillus velezensis]QPK89891.1 hypothetical protein IEN91_05485 [Bacillus velezensis]